LDGVLAADEAGNMLTAFYPAGDDVRLDDGPMPLALAAVWNEDRLLLVFNRLRQCWELPGGMIDPGETPYLAAVRELREEAGLNVPELTLAGYARFLLGPERRVEYAALFAARTTAHPGFTPNEEIAAIRWWTTDEPPAALVQPLDAYLGKLTR
jgi:8-oxo-dGTP diphosphatase